MHIEIWCGRPIRWSRKQTNKKQTNKRVHTHTHTHTCAHRCASLGTYLRQLLCYGSLNTIACGHMCTFHHSLCRFAASFESSRSKLHGMLACRLVFHQLHACLVAALSISLRIHARHAAQATSTSRGLQTIQSKQERSAFCQLKHLLNTQGRVSNHVCLLKEYAYGPQTISQALLSQLQTL